MVFYVIGFFGSAVISESLFLEIMAATDNSIAGDILNCIARAFTPNDPG
jgi:hypothetical protein